ncbi:MAG TPA: sugar ABC transporter ATP-binding protein [Trebonia sp.]|jgi:ABC-type sugar transport system ATPase subunit
MTTVDVASRLDIQDLSRSFGETKALRSATLRVAPGEIHSLAGENGSGKSTLIKILSGVLRPDSGTLTWEGDVKRHLASPSGAQAMGISTVFQETLFAPEMTVRDNIFLGTDRLFRYGRRKGAELDTARQAMSDLGLDGLDLDHPMWMLSLAERQLVTITRAIVRPWRLLILDESTSALDAQQRDRLFDYLRLARSQGKSVLFTSHRMDEVLGLADRITVLRQGTTVATMAVGEASRRGILGHMSGRAEGANMTSADTADIVSSAPPARPEADRAEAGQPGAAQAQAVGTPVLRTTGLTLRPSSRPISLEVGAGEILGLAGLEGQGQVEFVECLTGLRKPVSGELAALGASGTAYPVRHYSGANRLGIRYVPRDRRHEGLFGPLSVFDNFAVTLWTDFNRFGVLRRQQARKRFADFAESSRLVSASPARPISTLSGGNQQKILLGRWIAMRPRVLVVNDPLRGVDANTKEELYGLFRRLAADGVAIIYLSTEITELLTLTDQIAVFHEGSVVAMLPSETSSDTDVVAAMFGDEQPGGTQRVGADG